MLMNDMQIVFFIVAQTIGLVAIIVEMLSFQKNTKDQLLRLQVASCSLFGIQYLFLGAFSGALVNFVCVFRNYMFKKYKKIPFYLLLTVLTLFVVFTFLTYDGPKSLLPLCAMGMYTLALYTSDITKIRLAEVIGCILLLIYNVMVLAIFGAVANALVMTSTIVAIIIYNKKRSKKSSRKKSPKKVRR